MIKFILAIVFTMFCIAFAVLPETAMYFLWHLIHPESELARILVLGIFWFGGAGLCILFGFMGFVMWAHGFVGILES